MRAGESSYHLIDLRHQGRLESVAACLLDTRDGPVLIDPGPAATLAALSEGLTRHGYTIQDLSALLLTHIHLDHAGATGTLARSVPSLRVYVHEAGAPHVVDPSKLLGSATRLYGDRMDELWGDVAPVAAERVTALRGEERLALGERSIEVAYTPGHAWHHVSYFDPEHGAAFVGDTAGLYGPRFPIVLPVTPPPDFDLEAWLASIDRILAWGPREIVLTHYGPAADPSTHFATLRAGLLAWADYARASLELPGSDADRSRAFVASLEAWIDGKVPAAQARKFLEGAGPEACWQGLARYWRRKTAA